LRETGDEPIRAVVQDARMSEVYVAVYGKAADHPSEWHTLHEPVLLDAADVVSWVKQQAAGWARDNPLTVKVLGDALEAYPHILGDQALNDASTETLVLRCGAPLRASAQTVAQLAWHDFQKGRHVP